MIVVGAARVLGVGAALEAELLELEVLEEELELETLEADAALEAEAELEALEVEPELVALESEPEFDEPHPARTAAKSASVSGCRRRTGALINEDIFSEAPLLSVLESV